ncbi:MAG: hypothetical protein FJ388_00015 [Verrucomicrobia bacterium]|nr:hypothetical protein [Verrucomicrobiota bacterium]
MNRAQSITKRSIGVVLAIMAFMVAGCATVESPAQKALTCVQVEGRTLDQIHEALQTVLVSKGFFIRQDSFGARNDGFEMMFERRGLRKHEKAYGTWRSSWHGTGVWERLQVMVSKLSTGPYVIGLDAFMVSDPEAPDWTEEHKLTWMTRGTYRRMLEEVQARLK